MGVAQATAGRLPGTVPLVAFFVHIFPAMGLMLLNHAAPQSNEHGSSIGRAIVDMFAQGVAILCLLTFGVAAFVQYVRHMDQQLFRPDRTKLAASLWAAEAVVLLVGLTWFWND